MDYTIICGLCFVQCIMGRIMRIIRGLFILQWLVGRITEYNLWIIPIICGLYESDHNPHEQQLLALHQVRSFKRKTKNRVTTSKNCGSIFPEHVCFTWLKCPLCNTKKQKATSKTSSCCDNTSPFFLVAIETSVLGKRTYENY